MTTTQCQVCQGLGFVPKPFAKEGAFKTQDKYIWLIETEKCVFCKGTGKNDENN